MKWFLAGVLLLGLVGLVLAMIERRRGKFFLAHDLRRTPMTHADQDQAVIEAQIETRAVGDPFKH